MTIPTPLLTTPEKFITAQNGSLITTSLAVAEAFTREHKNVMQSIEALEGVGSG
ncbi:hypothetical protein [Serratia marcescens]|uniref:hypothetical protein n=1 Tax=Serratia marcescens TaxID=615 RepID=UPI0014954C02|nr:hypothetical protein [Serratia marcescens]